MYFGPLAMGRTSPQPVYRPRPLSPAPICGLPLSQRGQPRVPSSSLPTAHFLPATQCYRNMHTELGSRACVCVCVCAQVCTHTPESLSLERSQGAWGCLKRQPPQDSYLTPLKTCPPSSPCSRDRHLQKARKGYLGDPQLSPACVPHPLLPPPAQGPCSPPRSEFPTGLPASHDSVHTAWGSPGSGKLGHCPLIIHSTEITEYWGAAAGLGTQDTWKAKSVPTSPQTCRQ